MVKCHNCEALNRPQEEYPARPLPIPPNHIDDLHSRLIKVQQRVLPPTLKGAVYTVWIFICICMSLRVFLFAEKTKFLTKCGIHCISQVFPWHFYFIREYSLVELTEHDDSTANIIVHSSKYCCIHSTY